MDGYCFKVCSGRVLAVFILCVTFSLTAQAGELSKIIIAVQPTASVEKLSLEAKEVEEVLEASLGMDVEIKFPTSYAGVVEALRFGHAQAAFMGSWPGLLALTKASAEVVLAEVRDVYIDDQKSEAPYYYSYWVANKNSPHQSLVDLKGAKVAFPSALSSSGYVAPVAELVKEGFIAPKGGQPADPKDFLGEVIFAGGYAQGWEALKAGQVDATVIAGDVAESLYKEVLDNTKIIGRQGPIPSHVVVVSKDLPADIRAKLIEGLMAFNSDDKRPLMKKFVSGIFVRFQKADASHLQALKEMINLTGMEFSEKK